MIDFHSFEEFEGEKPCRLLDQHPDGKYVAMQIETIDAFFAAIWNTETKQLVWTPEGSLGLAWLHHGTQIALLQNPALSDEIFFTIYSWPEGDLLQQCALRFPFGYRFDLVVSPTSDFAVCQWIDQSEFGFEFITIHPDNIEHLAQDSYINQKTNFSTRPVFNPDGRLWVCAYQDDTSWWIERSSLEYPGKLEKDIRREIGAIIVFRQTQQLGEIPLIVTFPPGYHPPTKRYSPFFEDAQRISNLQFIDTKQVTIELPSEEVPIYDLSEF